MRLIDVDALNAKMYHEAFENDASYDENNPMARWDSGLWIRYKLFERVVESVTIVDSVRVLVRCKDCKYWDGYYCHNKGWGDGNAHYAPPIKTEDGFCDWGRWK